MAPIFAAARLAYDNETLLVSSVPETKTHDEDLNAVVMFTKAAKTRLEEHVS